MPRAALLLGYLFLGLSLYYIASKYMTSADRGECEKYVLTESVGRVLVGAMISRGAYSLVMEGTIVATSASVAIKIGMEPRAGLDTDHMLLSSLNGSDYFPFYYGHGTTSCTKKTGRAVEYPYVVMERLGRPLADIPDIVADRSQRLALAVSAAQDVLGGLEKLHDMGMLLHDIYPYNVLAAGDSIEGRFKLIDFGEAIPLREGWGAYNAINHIYTTLREDRREPISQRDDLERVVYLILATVDGRLPWDVEAGDADFRRSLKADLNVSDACTGFPVQIAQVLEHARNGLAYGEAIPFPKIKALLQAAIPAH